MALYKITNNSGQGLYLIVNVNNILGTILVPDGSSCYSNSITKCIEYYLGLDQVVCEDVTGREDVPLSLRAGGYALDFHTAPVDTVDDLPATGFPGMLIRVLDTGYVYKWDEGEGAWDLFESSTSVLNKIKKMVQDGVSVKVEGHNATTGDGALSASYEEDPDGLGIQRVVIAANWPYDTDKKAVKVYQNIYDDLNLNANLQVGKTDVSDSTPIPVKPVDSISDEFILANFMNEPGYGEEIDVSKYGMLRVRMTRNDYFNGTVTFQGLVSGSAYNDVPARNAFTGVLFESVLSDSSVQVYSEDYLVDVRGLNMIRVKVEGVNQGSIHVVGRGELWPEIQYINIANQEPVPTQLTGSNVASNQFVIPQGDLEELVIPTYDGSNQPIHPSVAYIPRKLGGYKYWMAFTPYPDLDNTKENPSIVASNDGYSWEVPTGITNPIFPAPTTGFYADTTLLWDGTKLHLFWMHAGDGATKYYHSESSDGITWSEKVLVETSTFSLKDGMYYANNTFYCVASPPTMNNWKDMFNRQSSATGLSYYRTRPIITNLETVGANHSSVYFDGAIYHFLTTSAPTITNPSASLYYGVSIDGNRVVYDLQPIVIPKSGTWYDKTLYTSCIVPGEDNNYFIYVSAINNSGESGIGVLPVKLNTGAVNFNFDCIKPNYPRTIFNAKEIRNTSAVISEAPIPEFNEYKDKTLIVTNTHDKPITLKLQQYLPSNCVDLYVGSSRVLQEVTIAAASHVCITSTDLLALGILFPNAIRVSITASEAPTSGSITVIIGGK